MTLNGVMAVTLRYFTEFGKHSFQHITAASSCGGIYALYFVSRVRCRRKESSRSLSHLLMSFLYMQAAGDISTATAFEICRTNLLGRPTWWINSQSASV